MEGGEREQARVARGVVSYLAPVLDKGLVGDEAEETGPEATEPCGTMVMGLGRPT